MPAKDKDWPGIISVIFSVVLAIATGAAAWGATRTEIAGIQEDSSHAHEDSTKLQDRVNGLEINEARTTQALEDISRRLTDISKELDKLNRSLDNTWKKNNRSEQ
jgi:uncharacterized coiled-coil protein SlyX